MYSVVENVLKNGGYNLNDIIRKIDVLWVKGSLTDDERNSLLSLARGGAKIENTVDVFHKLEELDKRMLAVENVCRDIENTTPQDYPEYQDGKWYYNGDKCSFEGENYTCIAPNRVVCVWSPSAYPQYWEKVE